MTADERLGEEVKKSVYELLTAIEGREIWYIPESEWVKVEIACRRSSERQVTEALRMAANERSKVNGAHITLGMVLGGIKTAHGFEGGRRAMRRAKEQPEERLRETP